MTHISRHAQVPLAPVTTPAESDNASPAQVAVLSDGSYVVAWSDAFRIRVQHFAADGVALGAAFTVGSQGNLGQYGGIVTALDNGGYVVSWSLDYDGSGRGAYAQVFGGNDTPTGDVFRVNGTITGNQDTGPFLKLASGGYVALIYSDEDAFNNPPYHGDLYLQRFDSGFVRVGVQQRINTTVGGDDFGSLVALDGGGFVAVWTQIVSNSDHRAWFQRYDADLNKVGGETRIDGAGDNLSAPVAVATAGGGFAIFWSEVSDPIHGGYSLLTRLAAADGSMGDVTTLRTVTGNQQSFSPQVTRLSDGDILLVWQEQASGNVIDGPAAHILFQRFSATGQPLGLAEQVDSGTSETPGNDFWRQPGGIAATNDGGFIITWTDHYGNHGVDMLRRYGADIAADDGVTHHYFGSAAETVNGGTGDDVYHLNNAATVITGDDGGTDTVIAGFTVSLIAGIENLNLGGDAAVNGTGNDLSNRVAGNGAANSLYGLAGNDTMDAGDGNDRLDGGAGADVLTGGAGNDTFVVDTASDIITETIDGGSDTVLAGSDYVLRANIENLTLTGAAAISGTGNDMNNVIRGNDGGNRLDGSLGFDTLAGGLGDDTYVVNSWDTTLVEKAGGGTDTIVTGIDSYNLGDAFENLTLSGAGNINAVGNGGDNRLTGNDGNNRLNGGLGADTLAGGKGDDTYVINDIGDLVVELAGEGIDTLYAFDANVSLVTLGAVENIWAQDGGVTALGNGLNNGITVVGYGNDLLDGKGGADTLNGGDGDDTYVIDDAGDVVIDNSGADFIFSSLSYGLGQGLESLALTGVANIDGTGNGLSNIVNGNAGSNRLDGGAGQDTLYGGAGNDTYVVDSAADMIGEAANEGRDTVVSSVRYSLGDNVERLTLTGTAGIAATGNALDNVLTGNAGNNRIDGGLGADTMSGGAGDDAFTVDNAGDRVFENASEGNDSVVAGFSYSLGTQYIENLTLTGMDDLTATGNALANTLIGNAGNNLLNGGSGADNMWGGAGNDSYYVDNVTDRTYEKTTAATDAGGHDIVYASVRVVLDQYVEDLVITGAAGLAGTGNGLDNSITGNSGNNVLSGKDGNDVIDGGAGADVMSGGFGNDTYFVDNVADRVVEANGQGYDTVYSSVSFSFGNQYFDTLTLTGTGDIDATGNAVANWLTGNDGANILNGGAGNDTVEGRGGSDVFVFGLKSGVDMITDFSAADGDTLDLHAWAHGVVGGGGIVITEAGSDTIVTLGGGNSVTVANATAGDVTTHIVW